MKKAITLQFPTLKSLWAFIEEVRIPAFELNVTKTFLTQELSAEEVEVAINKHNALVIDGALGDTEAFDGEIGDHE